MKTTPKTRATATPVDTESQAPDEIETTAPACILTFNASEPTGAGGIAGDIATMAAMGAHPVPVVTAIILRDTAEVFEHHPLDEEVVVEQARSILEDITISGWKVGFLGSVETVSAVAEVLSDYPDTPLVAYVSNVGWMEEATAQAYQEAYRELILPATEVLVGNHQTLTDLLLPDWDNERPPSARELAVAAGEHGTRHVLVTGILVPNKGATPWVDNVLASPEGAIAGEKFERFEATFVGAGETLSAALASLLAAGADLQTAVSEALSFLDESLDAGFRPGMGGVVPDRFFWALPPGEGEDEASDGSTPDGGAEPGDEPRRIH